MQPTDVVEPTGFPTGFSWWTYTTATWLQRADRTDFNWYYLLLGVEEDTLPISRVKEPSSIQCIAISTRTQFLMTKYGECWKSCSIKYRETIILIILSWKLRWVGNKIKDLGGDWEIRAEWCIALGVYHNEMLNCNWLIVMTEVTIISDCSY